MILINAYSALNSSLNQSERLKEELCKLGVQADIARNDFFAAYIGGEDIVCNAGEYDFCVYLDKDKYISHMLTKCGLRLFNSHAAIRACDDKMQTCILLANNGVPMPKTLAGLLCYDSGAKVSEQTVDRIERELGYPLVVKQSYGSLGNEVYLARNRHELSELCARLMGSPHLFQQFIAGSAGRDIRVITVGGKCVAAMERTSKNDFRSNIGRGGVGRKIELDEKAKALCEKVSAILGLDYCGIDLLYGDPYLVCEVNSNAFFGGIEAVSGINVAAIYARHIVNCVYGTRN